MHRFLEPLEELVCPLFFLVGFAEQQRAKEQPSERGDDVQD